MPEVIESSVVSIRTVVDLPAPFGPRKPNTSPERTVKSIPRTASMPPLKVRRKELAAIAAPVAPLLMDPVCRLADAATLLTHPSQFSGVWGTDRGGRRNSSRPSHPEATAVSLGGMIDFDAYARRVGVGTSPSVNEVHRAHVFAIPFENLDPHRGVPVSLEPEALERKLVANRRGGYCFEQNLLLGAALEAIGCEVEPLLARVRVGAPPGTIRPRSHLVLRVRDGEDVWLADVGFGLGTLIEPITFAPGTESEQLGWHFRLAEDGRELVLQTAVGDDWVDVFGFLPEPAPLVDIETSNWFTATSPRSPFVTGLVAATQRPDGTRVSLSDWGELSMTVLHAGIKRGHRRLSGRTVPAPARGAVRPAGIRVAR